MRRHPGKVLLMLAALMLAALLLGSGCQHSMDDLDAYIADVSARPPGPADPIPALRLPGPLCPPRCTAIRSASPDAAGRDVGENHNSAPQNLRIYLRHRRRNN